MNEVWNIAADFSAIVHRQARIQELSAEISKTRCGDCDKWMKNTCPREQPRGLSGFKNGPSCNALPCSLFDESQSSVILRQKRLNERLELMERAK